MNIKKCDDCGEESLCVYCYEKNQTPPPKGKIYKTGSNGETFLVDDPDYFNEDGQKIKRRFKPTNLTPKKKKRK